MKDTSTFYLMSSLHSLHRTRLKRFDHHIHQSESVTSHFSYRSNKKNKMKHMNSLFACLHKKNQYFPSRRSSKIGNFSGKNRFALPKDLLWWRSFIYKWHHETSRVFFSSPTNAQEKIVQKNHIIIHYSIDEVQSSVTLKILLGSWRSLC